MENERTPEQTRSYKVRADIEKLTFGNIGAEEICNYLTSPELEIYLKSYGKLVERTEVENTNSAIPRHFEELLSYKNMAIHVSKIAKKMGKHGSEGLVSRLKNELLPMMVSSLGVMAYHEEDIDEILVAPRK